MGYWIKAIAVGDNEVGAGGESSNRHFFMSIPYIRVRALDTSANSSRSRVIMRLYHNDQ
jgi:hypothetical protein